MSAVLRKRISRQEVLQHQLLAAVLPATFLVLFVILLLAFIGHFFPAG